MTAPGTVRTATELRIITLAASLDGWQTDPDDNDLWWVTGPLGNSSPTNDRVVVIGNPPDGRLEPSGMRMGEGGWIDAWTITCGLVCTAIEDPAEAKQACEDAFNQLADMLDANHRLVLAGQPDLGCRNVMVEMLEGPFFLQNPGEPPTAWINFNLGAQADIVRNRP